MSQARRKNTRVWDQGSLTDWQSCGQGSAFELLSSCVFQHCLVSDITSKAFVVYSLTTQVKADSSLSFAWALYAVRNAPSSSRSIEILNSTGLGIVDHVILFKSNWYKLTTSGDSTSSQFQHLGNRNTFWRYRLRHDRFRRTENRVCSSLNFCVEHTVLILSLSGTSLSHRTILHYVWPGSTCTRTITDEPYTLFVVQSALSRRP